MILSYPERGEGGDPRYRGNCSPKVYEWLIAQSKATSLIDPCIGGGTSIDVALRMGLQAQGSDLSESPYHQRLKERLETRGAVIHLGLDATHGAWGQHFQQADLVVAHPAYGSQIDYGLEQGDMSRMGDEEEFLDALYRMTMNMREVTVTGGHYAIIIGDTRKKGRYYSYQGELLARMPRTELRSVTLKAQHNMQSNARSYGHIPFGIIDHEYLLIWRREGTLHVAFEQIRSQQSQAQKSTWKHIVLSAMQRLAPDGKVIPLSHIYNEVLHDAPERVKVNPNYQAKVRQTLQLLKEVHSPEQGHFKLVI